MDLNIEFDKDEIADAVVERVRESLSEWLSIVVRDQFDYHEDRFRMSWMRMMEAELQDLVNSTKDNACNHGQKVYEGLFHVISEYFRVMREGAQKEDEDREEATQRETEIRVVNDVCDSPTCTLSQRAQAREAAQLRQELEQARVEALAETDPLVRAYNAQ